jgi:23S rRNA (adenine2030-N6)-methyltransferase
MTGVPDDGESNNELIDEFMTMQRSLGSSTYLGSAGIARRKLREGDDAVLFERSTDVHAALGESMNRLAPSSASAALSLRCEDGYSGLTKHAKRKRKLPRGLVLVDPPYQDGSDTDQTLKLVRSLRRDWRSARLALWYPISDRSADQMRRLENELLDDLDCDALRC